MSNTYAFSMKKSAFVRAGIGSAAAFALVLGGIAVSANAATNTYGPFHEGDNAMPLSVTEGLVFSKNADLGVFVDPTWTHTTATPLTPLGAVESLSYTVDSSVSTSTPVAAVGYAPSYQLVVYADRDSQTQKYTRLVWEPYMQGSSVDPSAGEYTDLQDGLWWTSKIASGDGSQAHPMPLAFFDDGGDAGWANVHIGAVTIHQGSTSDVTSVVSDVTYNGTHLQLGNVDTTPFNQGDIDDAVADATSPLNDTIADLASDKADLTTDLADANEQIDTLTQQLAASQAALTAATGPLGSQISALATQLNAAQNALTAYTISHPSNVGYSRATLATVPVHGKMVGVKLSGIIGSKATAVTYQWYVSGKPVTGATKAKYKVPASAKGKSVSVKVGGTYKSIAFAIHSNAVAAK